MLENLCRNCFSYAEVLHKLGIKCSGGNYETLKKNIIKYDIDIKHFTGKRWRSSPHFENRFSNGSREKYILEDVFKKNCTISQKVMRRSS